MTFLSTISVDFIEKWQTLIGSALGPFLAIIISITGFWVKGLFKKRSDRREAIRRAEISFAQTLQDIVTSVEQLEAFIERVNIVINTVKEVTDETTYTIQETNFPPMISIYFDDELPKMKFKSYYLHNKILAADYVIRWANSTTLEFKSYFEKLLKRNEMMAEKTQPKQQRASYIQSLEGFIKMVEDFLMTLKEQNAKSIMQAKIYNLKLMEKHFLTIWKYEKASFKYFKNRKEVEKYTSSWDTIDRINALIENDVQVLIAKTK